MSLEMGSRVLGCLFRADYICSSFFSGQSYGSDLLLECGVSCFLYLLVTVAVTAEYHAADLPTDSYKPSPPLSNSNPSIHPPYPPSPAQNLENGNLHPASAHRLDPPSTPSPHSALTTSPSWSTPPTPRHSHRPPSPPPSQSTPRS